MRSSVFLGAAAATAAGAAAQSISDAPSPTSSAGGDTPECNAAFSEVVTASIVGDIVYPFDGPEEDLAISYMKGLFYNTEDPCEPPVVTDAAVAEPFSEWFTSYTDYLSDNIRLYRTLYAGCWNVDAFLEGYPVTHMCSDFAIGVTSGIGATTEAGESTTTTATSAAGTGATESESAASSGNDASGSETSSQSPEETGGAGNNDGGDSEGQNENGNDGDDDSAAVRGVGSVIAAAGVAAACLLLAQLN